MFAVSSSWSSLPQYPYRPHNTSPLSPIHQNARVFNLMSSPTEQQQDKHNTTSVAPRFKHASARPLQPGSIKSPNERRQLRNAVLLKGVKDRRQNGRDNQRSEYIHRSDILAEQRAWEKSQEEEAARWTIREEDMDYQPDDPELEELIRREEEEIQARAAEAMRTTRDSPMEGYGSDNDELDLLLLEAMEDYEKNQSGMDLS